MPARTQRSTVSSRPARAAAPTPTKKEKEKEAATPASQQAETRKTSWSDKRTGLERALASARNEGFSDADFEKSAAYQGWLHRY